MKDVQQNRGLIYISIVIVLDCILLSVILLKNRVKLTLF
jgi:hypothetical protein